MTTRLHIYPHKRYYRYSDSPVADWLDDFAAWLNAAGYCRPVVRSHLSAVRLSLEPLAPLPLDTRFSRTDLEQIVAFPGRPEPHRLARLAFERFLRDRGRWIEPRSVEPHAELIAAFSHYLVEMRGLAPATVEQHVWTARAFLRTALPEGAPLADLSDVDVEGFIAERSRQMTRRSLGGEASRLRVFLRFCVERAKLPEGMEAIDIPRRYRDERPPRAIAWPLVLQLLDSIDRSTPVGLRDHTVFYLMAHYGLRTGEVPLLTLDSVDWQAGTLRIQQSKTRSVLLLPLTEPAADVLQRYLRDGRPPTERPELFLRSIAPIGPITRGAIAQAFRRRVRRSGLPLDDASPYGLRHSFAMRLLDRNVGVKAIGDLLGHRHLQTTSVYLRLQADALRDVALPLPGDCDAY
ncbi:MAG: tyrosine-type recombinase/integrase [Gammaproteobacteria bacterium]|nr:tyrosine-type recombinase/integrase [Gammaproteobacteria bacterium]